MLVRTVVGLGDCSFACRQRELTSRITASIDSRCRVNHLSRIADSIMARTSGEICDSGPAFGPVFLGSNAVARPPLFSHFSKSLYIIGGLTPIDLAASSISLMFLRGI